MAQQDQPDPETTRRLAAILAVINGGKSATQAAAELGVSRQTFYEWQNRALTALQEAMQARPPGRPAQPPCDPEKARLERENRELQRQVKIMEDAILIRDLLQGVPRFHAPDSPSAGPAPSRSKKKP